MPRRRQARLACAGQSPFDPALADYAHNLLVGTALRQLGSTMVRSFESADLVIEMLRPPRKAGAAVGDEPEELSGEQIERRLRAYRRRHRGRPRVPGRPFAPADANLALIAALVGLDEVEHDVLQFVLALHVSYDLGLISKALGALTLAGAAEVVAAAVSQPSDRVLAALGRKGRLVSSGLVTLEDRRSDLEEKLDAKNGLLDVVSMPGLDREGLLARFLPEAAPSTLDWDDMQHLRDRAVLARDILAAALRARRPGVNLLLYGATGSGKTELARLLAHDIEVPLLVAGGADQSGESATAGERLQSLVLGHRLVGSGRALLLFDELEDVFSWGPEPIYLMRAANRFSKLWLNEVLETNPVPTIWITNQIEGIDPAFLRRFAYAIEFRPLGSHQRACILARHVGEGTCLSPGDLESIAGRYTVSPAQFGTAVATARLIAPDGPDRATIERLLAPIDKIVSGADPSCRPMFDASGYRLDALNSSDDLVAIADRLAGWAPGAGPGLSICLYGPPGTGKSEYVKFLAHRMGRPVVHKRVSDILSKWVGEAEKHIAEAFRQAEDDDAVLLFDEVDSFLRDRTTAMQSWEVTQVNEFLQQLETFRGVVACTTNLWRDIDEASLRRFVLKIEFRYLQAEQALALFRSVFASEVEPMSEPDLTLARHAFARLRNLAPGDFAVVSRRLRALGLRPTTAELIAALVAEASAKATVTRAVGF